jgi:hypothetical protein
VDESLRTRNDGAQYANSKRDMSYAVSRWNISTTIRMPRTGMRVLCPHQCASHWCFCVHASSTSRSTSDFSIAYRTMSDSEGMTDNKKGLGIACVMGFNESVLSHALACSAEVRPHKVAAERSPLSGLSKYGEFISRLSGRINNQSVALLPRCLELLHWSSSCSPGRL